MLRKRRAVEVTAPPAVTPAQAGIQEVDLRQRRGLMDSPVKPENDGKGHCPRRHDRPGGRPLPSVMPAQAGIHYEVDLRQRRDLMDSPDKPENDGKGTAPAVIYRPGGRPLSFVMPAQAGIQEVDLRQRRDLMDSPDKPENDGKGHCPRRHDRPGGRPAPIQSCPRRRASRRLMFTSPLIALNCAMIYANNDEPL